jgi:hypothetical protein
MFTILHLYDNSFNRLFFSYIQTPVDFSIIPDNNFRIIGWILQRDNLDSLQISIASNEAVKTYEIDLLRNDVINAYGERNPVFLNQQNCGFDIFLPIAEFFKLSVIKNGVSYPWMTIFSRNDTETFFFAKNLWDCYCRSNINDIREQDIRAFDSLSVGERSALMMSAPTIVYNASQLIEYCGVQLKNQDLVKSFFRDIHSASYISGVIKSAIILNRLVIPSPFGEGFASCSENFVLNNNINVLKFLCADGEVFFIYQSITFCDAIFLPTRKIFISFRDIDILAARNYLVSIFSNVDLVIKCAKKSSSKKFIGLIVGHSRPYHYFYNNLPALEVLDRDSVLDRVPELFYSKGTNFFDESILFKRKTAAKQISAPELGRYLIDTNGFVCQVGLDHGHSASNKATIDSLDKKIVACVVDEMTSENINIESMRSCFPLIWFGVTSQKRSWLEQVEGAIYIFNKLSLSFPGLGIVFDGWTSPITSANGDAEQIKNDNLIIDSIRNSLNNSVKTFNVVGLTPIDKIRCALIIDCFIGNAGTGVIYVDRFCQKHGVGHINTGLLKSKQFIRKNISLISAENVIDVVIDGNDRLDYVSYHLDPSVVLDEVINIIIAKAIPTRLNGINNV